MNEEYRPDPDQLLKALQKEEIQSKKGKLKIFLGMSAGVGKTYAMLERAQKKTQDEVDVLVGTINTHGRQETANLLEGLKILPEKWIRYKDTVFEELDLDEILRLKPQLVLIDELAHSNIPGSRHPKRWQDVLEILDAGIDVYTTLNVQHIESLKDIIESIAGIVIHETVPDILIESAAHIELLDISPSELLQRLKEGKVYLGDQSAIAARNFFQEDRLTALREIALRFTAEKVDHDLHGMILAVERIEGWKPRERLLVAFSHSPHSQKLLRTTRRLAFNLNCPWIALYVETGIALDEEESAMFTKNLALAHQLGAEVITVTDPSIAQGIKRISKQKAVTQIILGRPSEESYWDLFNGASLVDELTHECREIDVHVIRQASHPVSFKKKKKFNIKLSFSPYLFALLFVLIVSVGSAFILPYVGYKIVGLIFLWGILVSSLFFKMGPTFFNAVLFALIWEYFFVPDFSIFNLNSHEDVALLILFIMTAFVTGKLATQAKISQEMLLKREAFTEGIYEIVREISIASSSKDVFDIIRDRLNLILKGSTEIIIKNIDDGLNWDAVPSIANDEKEKNVVSWVFDKGKEAGWSTSTLPLAKCLYVPLKGFNEIVGVLSYYNKSGKKSLNSEEFNFLYTVAQQLAYYIERSFAEERAHKIEYLHLIEKIYENILRIISEEFSAPLKSFNDALKNLKQSTLVNNQLIQMSSLKEIEKSAEGLNRLIGNISAMAALCSGLVPLNLSSQNIRQTVENCLKNMEEQLKKHVIKTHFAENLPNIDYDSSLIELLLHNLIFNAVQYTPVGTTIEIDVTLVEKNLVLSISDQGPGIPPDMMELVFEKFYRLPGTVTAGVGLGLPIARMIAEIHHGSLKVENKATGGSKFILTLPVQSNP